MQTYIVDLKSEVFKTFRCQKAANSLDIDSEKKSRHRLEIKADLKTPFNIGLIVGSSGSGKTTLAKKIFGEECFKNYLDPKKPIIEQFPKDWSYDDCAKALSGMGLTSVPCWIRPAYTLSNGQQARASAALSLAFNDDIIIIDEWTSVVDRVVAKAMSNCVNKYARKTNKKIILCSCHFDIIDWINPDFIIDCNKQKYIDRRSMVGAFERTDRLRTDIREVKRDTWRYFSKYHYLSSNLPGGKAYFYGLFCGKEQIGFGCYASYIPGKMNILYSNRVVIHPDYVGLGLGGKFVDQTATILSRKGYEIRAKMSSIPMVKARINNPLWKLILKEKHLKNHSFGKKMQRGKSGCHARSKVQTYTFKFNAEKV